MTDIDNLVSERAKTHGSFEDHARITQRLKFILDDECARRGRRNQQSLTSQHNEALDMICHKIGRIIAGDASFQDHWDDIAGYAKIANQDLDTDPVAAQINDLIGQQLEKDFTSGHTNS